MALVKTIIAALPNVGATVYCIVKRQADAYRLDDAGGAFASAPADPYISLSEDAVLKGVYTLAESRTVWTDGDYLVTCYKQTAGSPAPASDLVVSCSVGTIKTDAFVHVTDINRDMRGTDGALTSLSGIATATNVSDLQTHGDSTWATATGFATPTNVSDAQTAIIAAMPPSEQSYSAFYVSPSTIGLQGTVDEVDFYKDGLALIMSGTGLGQFRRITAWNNDLADPRGWVATITPDWVVNPDGTSVIQIIPFAFSSSGGGATPQQVWEYATRSLTTSLTDEVTPKDMAAIADVLAETVDGETVEELLRRIRASVAGASSLVKLTGSETLRKADGTTLGTRTIDQSSTTATRSAIA